MSIYIERLAKTTGKQESVFCDDVISEEKTAVTIAKANDLKESLVDMGDVIHVNGKMFLVEANQTVSEIKEPEYIYYKNIDVKDRVNRWFSESNN